MTKVEREAFDAAVEVVHRVLEMHRETLNCGVCGGEPNCDEDCPASAAKRAAALIEQVITGQPKRRKV